MTQNESHELKRLKRNARIYYEKYKALTEHHDCGAALSEYIVPEAAACRISFNQTMTDIAAIDPQAPAFRL